MAHHDPKATAIAFLQHAAAGRARSEAARYLAPGFLHHNLHFPGDANALLEAMDKNAEQFPGKTIDVVHAVRDGDLVATLCKVRHSPDETGWAVNHWFRFDGDRIAELWDLAQEIPKESPNQNGPF